MHSHFTVVFDACVLYPGTLRRVLVHLAGTGLFRARWSADIEAEWTNSLARNCPNIPSDRIEAARAAARAGVPDAVVSGHESLIAGLELPDVDDLHVLAAAIHCNAALIITTNLRDFPSDALEPYRVTAQSPDDFVVDLISLDSAKTVAEFAVMRSRLKRPPKSAIEFVDDLQRAGLPATAAALRTYVDEI